MQQQQRKLAVNDMRRYVLYYWNNPEDQGLYSYMRLIGPFSSQEDRDAWLVRAAPAKPDGELRPLESLGVETSQEFEEEEGWDDHGTD
jgi:hypothetical protein